MSKRIIATLSVAAIVLNLIAFVGFGPAFATQLRSCQTSIYSTSLYSCLTAGGGAVDIGFALYLGGVVAAIIAWIMGLVKTAQIGRWGWLAAVFLLPALGSLIYGVAGPTAKAN
jgi:hypothetical protein